MTSSLAMQSVVQAMLCGDEVKAVVADMGANTSRFGFGGQESPRHAFRSDIGLVAGDEASMEVVKNSFVGTKPLLSPVNGRLYDWPSPSCLAIAPILFTPTLRASS